MTDQKQLNHVAMIMDGNRRWAVSKGMPKIMGHTEGSKRVRDIAEACVERGITHLTLYALSTENVKNRTEKELNHLYSLIAKIADHLQDILSNGVQLRVLGDLSGIPEKPRKALESVVEKTKDNTKLTLALAINYGGRDELVRAIRKIVDAGMAAEDITEESFAEQLDSAGMPYPDLIIRTGGKQRLSNFLTWQSAYAELYFTDVYWPAFTPEELDKALDFFYGVERNFGK